MITHPTLQTRVQLEDIPSGKVFLTTFAEAMSENRLVKFQYRAFDKTEYYSVIGAPYCMKCFERRWYVVLYSEAWKEKDGRGIRHYALDRITSANILDQTFELPTDFSIDKYFKDFYGAYNDTNIPVELIHIRATLQQSKYIREIPLHSSQQAQLQPDGSYIFTYYLRPTIDFQQKNDELREAGGSTIASLLPYRHCHPSRRDGKTILIRSEIRMFYWDKEHAYLTSDKTFY